MDLAAHVDGINGIEKNWRLSKTLLKDHMPFCVPSDAPGGLCGT